MGFIYRGGFSLWNTPCVYSTQSHLFVFYKSPCFFENMIGLRQELKFSTLLCIEHTANNCQANLFIFICSYLNEFGCQLTCLRTKTKLMGTDSDTLWWKMIYCRFTVNSSFSFFSFLSEALYTERRMELVLALELF